MCGIVGLVGEQPIRADLMESLTALEYRGYDSAGAAIAGPGFVVRKVIGAAAELNLALEQAAPAGYVGIAHTRWATHGRSEARNAHPHVWAGIAVVHNGIIENHQELRDALVEAGHTFISDTDSEVIPRLISEAVKAGSGGLAALRQACAQLVGSFALAVLFEDQPDRIFVARRGSPLIVARAATGVVAVSSDPVAVASICNEYVALDDDQFGVLMSGSVRITNDNGVAATLSWTPLETGRTARGAAETDNHTRREIADQPTALQATDALLRHRVPPHFVVGAKRLVVIGCGSSLWAASVARPWIERLAGVPVDLEVASEYRYREPLIVPGSIAVLISQSGETADTLAVLEQLRSRRIPTLAIVNVPHSTLARRADAVWPTCAGREQGVAATKSFTAQLYALVRLGMAIGVCKGEVSGADATQLETELGAAPDACAATLGIEPMLERLGQLIARENEALFLGRSWAAAMAGEAALKLKELSYIRAEAYAAGELKHGPIALVREGSPVILIAASGALLAKSVSAAEEVAARGASVTVLTDAEGAAAFRCIARVIVLPGVGIAHVFAQAVAAQLLACHAALALGRNVDRPRNLAKSVTVE